MNRLNDNTDNIDALLSRAKECLIADGVDLDHDQVAKLRMHVELIREWNEVVGLVSTGDANALWERHVVDSLSLAGVIRRLGLESARLYDVGSGGGFPAIPIKVALPALRVDLIERSVKKVGFLRKVIAALALRDVTVHSMELSQFGQFDGASVVTARAIENPRKAAAEIGFRLGGASVFLSQLNLVFDDKFATERVEDQWTRAGLRRGSLDLVANREAYG